MEMLNDFYSLLVDDDAVHAQLILEHLSAAVDARFHTDWVDTPGKAKEALVDKPYDVVLLDYQLSGCTGIDLLDDIPGITARVPVIVLTSQPGRHADREAYRRGVFDFLDKTHLNPDLLERTIRYALQQFRTQSALRDSKERFEGLFNAVFEGIIVHDGGRILHANPAFGHLLGRNPEEIAGLRLSAIFGEAPVFTAPGQALSAGELEMGNERGEHLYLEWRSRHHLFDGLPTFLVAIRDVTPHKRLAAQLASMNEELEMRVEQRTEALRRSNQDLERFAYVIAHDIRAPLRTVREYLHEARSEGSESVVTGERALDKHFLDSAIETVDHLRGLIQAVLDYSRISSRATPMEAVRLDEVMGQVLVHMDAEFQKAGAAVRVAELPEVRGNRLLLCDLFRNLLHNAVKYRGSNPLVVSVTAVELGACWQLSVHDNGVGFHPGESEDIFIVLHRGSSATGKPGDGMGLALCKKIVELHGGQIWAHSAPGQGAGFFFTLPKNEVSQEPVGETGGYVHEDYCCRG